MHEDFELKFRKFHDLMPHRIREILLVSSPYNAFIMEEDGALTERLFMEYSELNLSSAPRVTHAKTAEDALEKLISRRFDMIITTMHIPDMDTFAFCRRVKALRPGRPLVLLVMDDLELQQLPANLDPKIIDKVFMWIGDAKIILAMIKYIEDGQNVVEDIQKADIHAIIVVEDSVRYYSTFLSLLYTELMKQSQSLIAEGFNDLHRLMRMRARPKVLLASTYEEAEGLYNRYKNNLLAVISDVRYAKNNKDDGEAGFKLLTKIRGERPTLPVVLQSADQANEVRAHELGAIFCNKNHPGLNMVIENFLKENLGFGDFTFKMPDGRELAQAKNLFEMEKVLQSLPGESLEYHARNNHISVWLMARSEFDLARNLRPRKVSDFPTIEGVRNYLIKALGEARRETQRGAIADFSPGSYDPNIPFLRLGGGSIGGKARGIAFMNGWLVRKKAQTRFPELPIVIPQTLAIGTDWFDEFMEENNLRDIAYNEDDDHKILAAFLEGKLSKQLVWNLSIVLRTISHPLAVRSSSLLEDSQFRPFAGIYATVMLPNNDSDPAVRLDQLGKAIKTIYASTYSANAKSYMEATPNRIEDEKMAVVIQKLVGQPYGARYYPTLGGVAQSYNYYPIGAQKAEDGVAQVVLGLGKGVVEGGLALRFSPAHPQVLPQFASAKAALKFSQKSFYALDLTCSNADMNEGPGCTLTERSLSEAEADQTLQLVGSTYNPDDDQIRDSFEEPGPRLVTLNNILVHKMIPLAPALQFLLEIGSEGLGAPVEIEFAVDFGDWGKTLRRGVQRVSPSLYFLQLRPMISREQKAGASADVFEQSKRLCYSNSAMGYGCLENLRNLVYVRRDTFDPAHTRQIAEEIGRINKQLHQEGERFILIGPGRWGSADPWLGIPVQWQQISQAGTIVEASPEWFQVDPSQGTHFFQNITSLRIGYLTVLPVGNRQAAGESQQDFMDWDWLDGQSAMQETKHLRHLKFDAPLIVHLDGQKGKGVIAKPGTTCSG